MSKSEYDGLPPTYKKEGVACYILDNQIRDHIPLYRLYKGSIDDHFYTTSDEEKNSAINAGGYTDEGIAGYVRASPSQGHIPLYRAYHPGIGDHFYTTSMAEIEAVAPKIGNKKLKKLLEKRLDDFMKDCEIYTADKSYHTPQEHIARMLVDRSQVDQETYISEKFDCDDFAHLLKTEFIKDAYTNGLRRLPYALGVVWGAKPAHAMNIIVTSNGKRRKLRIIEPQTGAFYLPSDKKLDDIYLIVF
jgi:hypothetical protein